MPLYRVATNCTRKIWSISCFAQGDTRGNSLGFVIWFVMFLGRLLLSPKVVCLHACNSCPSRMLKKGCDVVGPDLDAPHAKTKPDCRIFSVQIVTHCRPTNTTHMHAFAVYIRCSLRFRHCSSKLTTGKQRDLSVLLYTSTVMKYHPV